MCFCTILLVLNFRNPSIHGTKKHKFSSKNYLLFCINRSTFLKKQILTTLWINILHRKTKKHGSTCSASLQTQLVHFRLLCLLFIQISGTNMYSMTYVFFNGSEGGGKKGKMGKKTIQFFISVFQYKKCQRVF